VKTVHHINPIAVSADPISVTLIERQPQKVWGRLAVINFTFGSAGAGLYLLSVWFQMVALKISSVPSLFVLRLVSAALVCFGLLAVAGEAGRPAKAPFLLGNLRRSWMSRETAAATAFIPLAILSAFDLGPALATVTAVMAMFFIVSQGFIIYRSRAIPAWNLPTVPVLFISSAFAAGSGLLLMLPAQAGIDAGNIALLITSLVCSATDLFFWLLYICPPVIDQSVRLATASLRKRTSTLSTVGLGRITPIVVLLFYLLSSGDRHNNSNIDLTIAGVLLFCGSWAQKTAIIRRCGHLVPIQFSFRADTR
jgi:DMSO reductase anchor subunit